MEEKEIATSSARTKVSTGYSRLDEALQGGFLAGTAVVLSAPASDEIPLLIGNFLRVPKEQGLLICRTLSSAETITQNIGENVRSLVCSDKPVSPARGIIQGNGIENLTDLNLQINEVVASTQPKRLVIEVLSDILLRHKALQTRKWLTELLERLRSKGITTLATLNPYMHSNEETQAVVDLFDGNLEIIEKDVEGTLRKFIRIKWMHGADVPEKEFAIFDLVPESEIQHAQPVTSATPIKEPRWLTPLVNRATELSRLKAAFEDALASKSSIVALQGEAGVGKTRLMRELALAAQVKGAVVLTGKAREEKLSYGPWVELLREYVGQTPGEILRRMLGVQISEFARLIPDISAKVGTVPPSKTLGEEQDRVRLYEAITQFLVSICREKPLFLSFDDMHWADQASLDLLEYFARSTSNLRVFALSSYRSEDVTSDTPLYKTLMKLNRERVLETIPVKNLNKEDTARLITEVFGEQVSSEFADLMYQRTGGNPFFVEEVLRSLVEEGTIFRTKEKWDRKPIQKLTIPESVKATLRSRLTKLQAEAVSVLTMAAVTGSEFDFDVLREVTQIQEDMLLERLEAAISSGLIVEIPRRKDVFRFADNRIRELLLGDLSQSRRARYHVKVGEAMETVYSKDIDSHAEDLAFHFSEGGDTGRGIGYSIMAGDRNKVIHAYEQAISDYKRALDLIDLQGGEDNQKALTQEKLGECYLASQLQESKRYLEQALVIYEKLGDQKACARTCLKLAEALHKIWTGGVLEESIVTLKRGLRYLEGNPESFEAASIYSRLALHTGILDDWDEANSWADKALEVGERSNNSAAVCGGLMIKGSYLTDTGKIDEGLPLWERAYETALQHEHYSEAFFSLSNLALYTYPRSLSKARELLVRLLDLSKRVNDMSAQNTAYLQLGNLDWFGGNWTVALEEHHNWVEIGKRIGLPVSSTDPFWYSLILGDLSQAEMGLQEMSKFFEGTRKASSIVLVNLLWGQLRLEQERDAEAKVHFEKSVEAFRKWEFTSWPLDHIDTLLHLTKLHVRDGELEQARKMSAWAKRLAETLKSDAGLAMASQAEGNVLLAGGEGKGAEEAYLKSLGLWEKAGWPYYQAKALVEYSEAIAQTNPEQSKNRLAQATEIFRKLGAKRDLEKAEAKLAART